MFTFLDENGCRIDLSFEANQFQIAPKHVLVMVQFEGKWLCAINKKRGIEYPGGKLEPGETLEQAAVREVYEETSVHITELKWFADYLVHGDVPFCKAVFTAKIEKMDHFIEEYETIGRVWLSTEELHNHPDLSFYMRDEGMKKMLQEVKQHERQW